MRVTDFRDWCEDNLQILGSGEGRGGFQFHAVCPWCGGDQFYVSPSKKLWICYRANCESRRVNPHAPKGGGTAWQLIREVDGCSDAIARARAVGWGGKLTPPMESIKARVRDDKVDDEVEPEIRSLPDGFRPVQPDAYPKYLSDRLDLKALVRASEGYTGAEIAEGVVAAMFEAFSDAARPVAQADLESAVSQSTPMSKSHGEAIAQMYTWGRTNAMPAS